MMGDSRAIFRRVGRRSPRLSTTLALASAVDDRETDTDSVHY